LRQLADALTAPLAIIRLPARAWVWLALYLGLAGALLGGVAWAITAHEGALTGLVLDYLVPEPWHTAARVLFDGLLAAQRDAVVVNLIASGGLLLATVLLFPVKEAVSTAFERNAQLSDEPMRELPLRTQAWEELTLFLGVIAAQSAILWLGYPPGTGRAVAAVTASYLLLFATFAVDFLSPVLQRHEGRYSRILKTLARRPLESLAFGAIFALPAVLAGQLWAAKPSWSVATAISAIFAANVLAVAWAAVAGTWLGAKLLPDHRRTRPASRATATLAWALVIGTLVVNGYRFGAVAIAVHHKSQLLKCHYDVAWGSFEVDTPSVLGAIGALAGDRVELGVSFEVAIENPTAFELEIEDNRFEIRHRGALVATPRLSPLAVPAGATVRQRVAFELALAPSAARGGRALFDRTAWEVTLYLRVAEHFELPVYLVRARL
jgi:hypothetical protein